MIKKLLNTYQKTLSSIFEKFGYEDGGGEIDLKLDVVWTSIGNEEVKWVEGGDLVYSNETMHMEPLYCENYVMFYVDNGSGERFYQIFDMNKRNDSVDFWDSFE